MPIAVAVVAIGCGGPTDGRLQITGEVTFDGQPVADGYVTLSPLGSGPSAGGRIQDGEFVIERDKGPMAGKYRVVLQAMRETGRMIPIDPALPHDTVAETVQYIPPHYNTRSQLTADLSPDNRHLVLELSSTAP
jgi:hypothetical protein